MAQFRPNQKAELQQWVASRVADKRWKRPRFLSDVKSLAKFMLAGRYVWLRALMGAYTGYFNAVMRSPLFEESERGNLNESLSPDDLPSVVERLEVILMCTILDTGRNREGLNIASFLIGAAVEWGWRPSKNPTRWFAVHIPDTDPFGIQGWLDISTLETMVAAIPNLPANNFTSVTLMAAGLPTSPLYYTAIVYRCLRYITTMNTAYRYNDSTSFLTSVREVRTANDDSLGSWRVSGICACQCCLGDPGWLLSRKDQNKLSGSKRMDYAPKNWGGVTILSRMSDGVDELAGSGLTIDGAVTGRRGAYPTQEFMKEHLLASFKDGNGWDLRNANSQKRSMDDSHVGVSRLLWLKSLANYASIDRVTDEPGSSEGTITLNQIFLPI